MGHVTFVGTIAAICTSVAFVPQVIKIHRTKHTGDLSLAMYIIFSSGICLWLYYGIAINSFPVILANGITLIFSLYILFMKIKYR